MGEGRKKAKESRVVPHPKLNPGCATGLAAYIHVGDYELVRTSYESCVNEGSTLCSVIGTSVTSCEQVILLTASR